MPDMGRDILSKVSDLQENPIAKGRELEFSLLGPSPGAKYDPEKDHDGVREKDIQSVDVARVIVRNDINNKERLAETAEEDEPNFQYSEITTMPESPYVFSMYDELARILECNDPSEQKIRYYNTLGTILDIRFGTDFMIEVKPEALSEKKFGKGIRELREPVFVSVDITGNQSKSASKADVVLQFDRVPENLEERKKLGRQAALRVLEVIISKLKSQFLVRGNPPVIEEINAIWEAERQKNKPKSEPAATVTKISAGVVKRVKNVEKNA